MTTINREAAKAAAMNAKAAQEAVAANVKLEARKAFFASAFNAGASKEKAAQSQVSAAFQYNAGIRAGFLTSADAGEMYRNWTEGRKLAQAEGTVKLEGVDYDVTGDKPEVQVISDGNAAKDKAEKAKAAERVAVSTFGTFGRPEVVALGLEIFPLMRKLRNEITPEGRAHSDLFLAFVGCNRAISAYAVDSKATDASFADGTFKAKFPVSVLVKALTKKPEGNATLADKFAKLREAVKKFAKAATEAGKFDGIDTLADTLEMIAACETRGVAFPRGVKSELVKAADMPKAEADAEGTLAEAAEKAKAEKAEALAKREADAKAKREANKAAKAKAAEKAKAEAEKAKADKAAASRKEVADAVKAAALNGASTAIAQAMQVAASH